MQQVKWTVTRGFVRGGSICHEVERHEFVNFDDLHLRSAGGQNRGNGGAFPPSHSKTHDGWKYARCGHLIFCTFFGGEVT